MVTVSEKAANRIKSMLSERNEPEAFIRVAVTSGGCSGLSYNLDFEASPTEGDEKFENNGVRLLIDKKSFFYLIGTELDFSDGLNGKGFNFKNPNANRTCACGESFSL